MAYQTALTIESVIKDIDSKKYLLPSIQREFVWSTGQIEKLFDSLMRDYPINAFLFWKVPREKVSEFKFYEFLRDYHQKDNKHNPKANTNGTEDIIAILDGQQRMTSLYIALKGTYAYKMSYKRWDNPAAYPKRKLYLNLLAASDDADMFYDFLFLTEEEAKNIKNDNDEYEGSFWFPVGKMQDKCKEPMKGILHHKEGVDLIPSNSDLFDFEISLVTAMNREAILRNYLNEVKHNYDYIIIDCSPSLGMMTLNALSAADSVIIPVQAHYLPAKCMTQLMRTITKVKKHINPKLNIDGILLTLVDNRTNLAKSTIDALRENFGSYIKIYNTHIPIAIKAAEVSSKGKSIYAYEPNSTVSKAYTEFSKEVLADGRKKERLHSAQVR